MIKALTFTVGFAAGYGAAAVAGKQPTAQLQALLRGSSRVTGAQHGAGGPSSAARAVADSARSVFHQAAAKVGATPGPHDSASGTPATSGGVIPLGAVPIDQLSEWELDLLTTPDAVR